MVDAKRQRKKQTALARYKRSGELGNCCAGCGWSVPGCENGDGLDIHHVRPVKRGGGDEVDNLVLLCPNCHRIAHKFFHCGSVGQIVLSKKALLDELTLLSVDRACFESKYFSPLTDEDLFGDEYINTELEDGDGAAD